MLSTQILIKIVLSTGIASYILSHNCYPTIAWLLPSLVCSVLYCLSCSNVRWIGPWTRMLYLFIPLYVSIFLLSDISLACSHYSILGLLQSTQGWYCRSIRNLSFECSCHTNRQWLDIHYIHPFGRHVHWNGWKEEQLELLLALHWHSHLWSVPCCNRIDHSIHFLGY